MKKTLLALYLLALTLLFSQLTLAQDEDSVSVVKRKSHLKIELSYLNDNVYMGRSDSAKVPYITAGLRYIHKSGLFAELSTSYLTTEDRPDLVQLSGGYMFSKGNWEGEISANKYFYNADSYNVNAETTADLNLYTAYDFGVIQPSFTGEMKFSSGATDYVTTFGLEHDFSFFNESLLVEPCVYMNAATQNYYNQYYEKRKYAVNRKGVKKAVGTVTANTENASKFKILDYELTAPIEFVQHRFTFSFTPTYAIPVNPNQVNITVTTNTTTRTRMQTETLNNHFYWCAGVSFKI